MRLKLGFRVMLFLIFFGISMVRAQSSPTPEYQVKAAFLLNFTHFVVWPHTAFKNADDPFVIGILGDDPFGPYLEETVAGQKMMNHIFSIRRFHDLKDLEKCHMLFLNSSDSKETRETLAALTDRNTLTVSDTGNFVQLGGMIRFFIRDNKVRIQINPETAKSAGLNISSKLLRIAEISR